MSERPLGVSLIGAFYIIAGVLLTVLGVLGTPSIITKASELPGALVFLFLLIEKIFFGLQGSVHIFRVVFLNARIDSTTSF